MAPDHSRMRSLSRIAAPGQAGDTARARRSRRSRRATLRALAGCALAAPALLRAPGAGAIKGWCRRDPVVEIDGRTAHIVLSSDTAMHGLATGPTQLVITVPAGTATRFLADDPGFGHHGYDVRFTESPDLLADDRALDIQIEAYAPAADTEAGPLPLVLEFTPRGDDRPVVSRTEGRANEWVSLHTNVTVRDDAPPANVPPAKDKKGKNGKRDRQDRQDRQGKAAKARGNQATP